MTSDHPALATISSPARGSKAALTWADLAYGSVTIASTLPWAIVDGWLLYFYLPPVPAGGRVPAALYGVPVLAVSLLNIFLNPVIGHLSDQARGRWGRRLPFVGIGAVPLLAAFVLLWRPPVAASSAFNLVYLTAILAVYTLAYSAVMVPLTALLPELTQSEAHRVRLASLWAGAQMLGVMLTAFAGPLITEFGYAGMAQIYAVIAIPLFYLPFLVLRERPGSQTPVSARLGFRTGLAFTVRNRPFLILTAAGLCSGTAIAFSLIVVPYLVTEICVLAQASSVWFFGLAVVASLVCYPLVTWLALQIGKWRVLVGALALAGLALPALALIGPWWPLPLMAQGLIWVAVESAATAPVIVLPPAIIADLTDDDARRTAQRREGAFYSVWVLQNQTVTGLAAAVVPLILLLGRSRFDPRGPLGVRVVSLIGGGLCLLAGWLCWRYPLHTAPGDQNAGHADPYA